MRRIFLIALMLTALFSNSVLRADDWNFVVAPYLVVPSISGDTSLGRIDGVDVDVDPGDILESLEMGGMLQVEAHHRSGVGLVLNYSFMDLGQDATGPLGFTNFDADIFQGVLEGFLSYTLGTEESRFDLYGGVRWWDIGIDVDADTPAGSRTFSRDEGWVDPVVGARWMPKLGESWKALIQGDIGGFGAASEVTWNAQAGFIWDAWPSTSMVILYKALAVDYTSGTRGSSDFFEYDTVTQGPLLGIIFRM